MSFMYYGEQTWVNLECLYKLGLEITLIIFEFNPNHIKTPVLLNICFVM